MIPEEKLDPYYYERQNEEGIKAAKQILKALKMYNDLCRQAKENAGL